MAAYIVKVTIEDTHPPVWRRIAIPEKILYGDLHVILQAAFGWYDAHLHDFSFPGSDFRVVMSEEDMTAILQLDTAQPLIMPSHHSPEITKWFMSLLPRK